MKKLYGKMIAGFSLIVLFFAYIVDKATDNKLPWE